MSIAIITGSSGLIGSEASRYFHEKGFFIVGIDNDMRKYFFGADASTDWNTKELQSSLKNFTHVNIDIRDKTGIHEIFQKYGKSISLIIHTASQPSHDWAAREPFTDFTVNANGTLNLLEATRQYCKDATFIFTSTNKVYGDSPNRLPLKEKEYRWEIDSSHPYFKFGIDEKLTVDQSTHSLFGVSKLAADILVQEYGRYFGLKTGVFRGGCLTGPAHSGTELHGFLAYLVKCAVLKKSYTVFGYKGKQVRDNIHSFDLVNAFWHFHQKPKSGAVYNIGGSRFSNCSVIEAISMIETMTGFPMDYSIVEQSRVGDHIWWISDVRRFQNDFPEWNLHYDVNRILKEIVEAVMEREKIR
jgi:CDP-paratose 2-epimerase